LDAGLTIFAGVSPNVRASTIGVALQGW